ncbi:MAG TPA: serine hydrolase domain-containing protein [Armatimonadota bacterium]|jgi:CubicO group peptidase (beta-lactamase class C family)
MGTHAFSQVEAMVRERLASSALPSLAVAVARDGEVLWEAAWGWASRERRIPATPHTLYSLASISKPITATGVMLLKERGKVDLDAPIDDYLGEAKLRAWVGDAKDATVRRIASHSAGLHTHCQFFYADEPHRPPSMEETVRRYGHIVHPPGQRRVYCNLGYGLLDTLISRHSGKPYADLMREDVFLPLGLTHTSVDIGLGLEPYAAERYGADGIAYPFYEFDHPGGSAVYSSAHDLLRFGMFHLGNRLPEQAALLSPESLEEMRRLVPAEQEPFGYGVGWYVKADECGYPVVYHGGGMGGVNTILKLVPSERIAVVALCNACTDLPFEAAAEMLAVLLPDYAERREREQAEAAQTASKEGPTQAAPPPAEAVGEWKGIVHTYDGDLPFSLRVKPDGDLHARIGEDLPALVNEATWEGGQLTGVMVGDLRTEDVRRWSCRLHLDLTLRGNSLSGAVLAVHHQDAQQGGAPGRRLGNAISHWAELKREGAGS